MHILVHILGIKSPVPVIDGSEEEKQTQRGKSLTSFDSPKTCLLSECPKITQLTPTSFIMAGLETEETDCRKWAFSTLLAKTCGFAQPENSGNIPDFSCKSSFGQLVTILCSHPNLGIKFLTGKVKVDGRGTTNHLWSKKKNIMWDKARNLKCPFNRRLTIHSFAFKSVQFSYDIHRIHMSPKSHPLLALGLYNWCNLIAMS